MTGSLAMLATARRGAQRLAAESADVVAAFLTGCVAGGGFRGRSEGTDLYYTAFGIDGLLALGRELPGGLGDFLSGFGEGDGLDLVHLACLVRCRARWLAGSADPLRERLSAGVERFRSGDGGYSREPGAVAGTVYGAFLGAGAWDDLGGRPPKLLRLAGSVRACRLRDGSFADRRGMDGGSTPATAAAVTLGARAGRRQRRAEAWLEQRFTECGGVTAGPQVSAPDLLSTATALYALESAGATADITPAQRDATEALVEALWDESGGFCGAPGDAAPDCEYTFYALLALGCL